MHSPSQPHDYVLLPDERMDEINADLRLIQKKNGLTFGTDAYLLAAFVRPMPRARAVDLGSGTGILPLLLAAHKKVMHTVAVEIQPSFAELIAKNAALNHYTAQITPMCIDLRELTAAHVGGEVDLVLANPPYMRCDSGKRNLYDEKYIARHEVCGDIGDFCSAAGRILKYGGRFVSVWRPDRLSELYAALRAANLEPKRTVFVHADAESEPCAVLTEAVKGAAPSQRISPPLILYCRREEGEQTRRLTPAAQAIYDTGHFDT